jgi:acyl-coenzyme A synthetase/AMP-(fatty) acid ligase
VLLDERPTPAKVFEVMHRDQPTMFFGAATGYAGMLVDPACAPEKGSQRLRLCISAGEALPEHVGLKWRERYGVDILDGIGSTEMLHIFCSNVPGQVVRGSTGRPVPGYELRIVDEDGAVLAGEAVGNLEVRGDSCAAFYWHQHEKTKSCMRGDWFASGDRYERREDGAYVYVGRMDDMLKIGGLWVSPIDMEHVLLQHPRVRGAGVVGVTVDDVTRVAAYVECAEDDAGDDALADELRAWCKERLRRYEYPHIVEFVDDLPRTLTGKVQRFALRDRAARGAVV